MIDDLNFSQPASHSLSQQAPEPAPPGSGAVPLTCVFLFCGKPATHGDLCEGCWEKTQDIRAEWDSLRAEYEGDGW